MMMMVVMVMIVCFLSQGGVPVDAEGPVPQAMRVLRRPHHVQQQVLPRGPVNAKSQSVSSILYVRVLSHSLQLRSSGPVRQAEHHTYGGRLGIISRARYGLPFALPSFAGRRAVTGNGNISVESASSFQLSSQTSRCYRLVGTDLATDIASTRMRAARGRGCALMCVSRGFKSRRPALSVPMCHFPVRVVYLDR